MMSRRCLLDYLTINTVSQCGIQEKNGEIFGYEKIKNEYSLLVSNRENADSLF